MNINNTRCNDNLPTDSIQFDQVIRKYGPDSDKSSIGKGIYLDYNEKYISSGIRFPTMSLSTEEYYNSSIGTVKSHSTQ